MTTATGAQMMLRETRWSDIPALAELETELFGAHAWSAPSWWAELAARPRRAYVTASAGADHRVLGYAGVDRGGAVADVMTIAVAPAARGTGLGRALLHRLYELAAPAEALLLEVRADNTAARSLYEAEGFEVLSVRRRYYGDVDALVMRRHLPARIGGGTDGSPKEEQR